MYAQAVVLRPNSASLLYNMAIAHRAMGQQHAAVHSYERALELAPGMRSAHFNKARSPSPGLSEQMKGFLQQKKHKSKDKAVRAVLIDL